ncbi:MAG: hypothetical protein AAGF09_03470 [Pseudomonadota bacterium]
MAAVEGLAGATFSALTGVVTAFLDVLAEDFALLAALATALAAFLTAAFVGTVATGLAGPLPLARAVLVFGFAFLGTALAVAAVGLEASRFDTPVSDLLGFDVSDFTRGARPLGLVVASFVISQSPLNASNAPSRS